MPFAQRREPVAPGRPVTASVSIGDGDVVLTVRGDVQDDDVTRARLRRFIQPMAACVALSCELGKRTAPARSAVAQIESEAISNLATGIVMARRDCDAAIARQALAEWSERTGLDVRTLSAARMLELLTADQSGSGSRSS